MRGRLSIRWIWHNVYPADFHWYIKDGAECRACNTKHRMLIPRLQWSNSLFQGMKMDDHSYRAKIEGQEYTFDEFITYTRINGQLGDVFLMNKGPHITLDNGHHRYYIAWLLGEEYVRVNIAGMSNVIPEAAFEPNSINSEYLYI